MTARLRTLTVAAGLTFGVVAATWAAPTTRSIPDELKRAINEYYVINPADEGRTLEELGIQSVDLVGDGKPEYLIQISSESGSDGEVSCSKLLFAPKNDGTYQMVDIISCCKVQTVAARAGKGGKLVCFDDKKVAFEWKGAYPSRKWDLTTLSQVKSDYAKGRQLFVAKNYAAAEPLMCSYLDLEGDRLPEYANACGAVRIALGKYDEAEYALQQASQAHPEFTELYAQLGKVAEAKGQRKEAIDYYSKYLAMAKPGTGRTAIEARLKTLQH